MAWERSAGPSRRLRVAAPARGGNDLVRKFGCELSYRITKIAASSESPRAFGRSVTTRRFLTGGEGGEAQLREQAGGRFRPHSLHGEST